jgi:hypothetical protein
VLEKETLGVGDFGARIDAETARTGLSDEEISDKVYISISYISIQTSQSYIIRKENWFKFLSSCNVRLRILPAEGMRY